MKFVAVVATLCSAVIVLGAPRGASAQAVDSAPASGARSRAASPYMPLDDAAYRYIDALLARGALRSLSMLERPYLVGDVRRAIAGTDSSRQGRVARGWIAALDRALDRVAPRARTDDGDDPVLRGALLVGGTVESSARRELTRADDSTGAHAAIAGRGVMAAGPVVAVVRIALDQRLKDDPEFSGSKIRSVTGRTEDAYVTAQWRWATLFAGRQSRSWGPSPLSGLQLGDAAYSWDHFAGTLGTDRLRFTSVLARLDPYAAGADSGQYERHLAMHRLQARFGGVEVALAEGVLYGGVGRGTELAYANPLSLYQLAQYNETRDGNVSYTADVAWRTGRAGVLTAQLLVDDLQIDRCSTTCEEPASLGWTMAAEGLPLVGAHRAFASYTRVSNLTYRSPQPWERWSSFDVGLARAASDYDEARLGVDLALLSAAPLRAYVARRRQGEGDYRLPFPPTSDYGTTPAFLAGVVERTWRVGVSGGGVVSGFLEIAGDIGYNTVQDADHVGGRSRAGVEGRLRGTVHLVSPAWRP